MSRERFVAFAGAWVAIELTGEDAEGVAAFLFSGFPACSRPAGDPAMLYRLHPGTEPGTLRLDRGGELFWEVDDPGQAAELLLAIVSRDLALNIRGGLLLHAGVLATRSGGLVLPALSGCGKTTLVTWLAARGMVFGSDEMAFVPDDTGEVLPFPRPLNVKQPSAELVRGFFALERHYGQTFENPHGLLISPRVFAPEGPCPPLSWTLLVFPRYEAGASFSLERLSKARAGMELLRHVINGARLRDKGFPAVARLAAMAPAYRLVYSDFAQLGPLEELLAGS